MNESKIIWTMMAVLLGLNGFVLLRGSRLSEHVMGFETRLQDMRHEYQNNESFESAENTAQEGVPSRAQLHAQINMLERKIMEHDDKLKVLQAQAASPTEVPGIDVSSADPQSRLEQVESVALSSDQNQENAIETDVVSKETKGALFTSGVFDSLNQVQENFDAVKSSQARGISIEDINIDPKVSIFADYSGDGIITKGELRRVLRDRDNAIRIAEERDTQDGQMPIPKEYYRGSSKKFNYIDADSDNILTVDEYMNYQRKGYVERLKYDANKDGFIDMEELGQGEVRFNQIEALANRKDGKLDTGEILHALGLGLW